MVLKKLSKLEDNFYPDITEYLDKNRPFKPQIVGLEQMVAFVQARTGLDKSVVKIILTAVFEEMMSCIQRGDKICLNEIGELYLAKSGVIQFRGSTRIKRALNGKEKRKWK